MATSFTYQGIAFKGDLEESRRSYRVCKSQGWEGCFMDFCINWRELRGETNIRLAKMFANIDRLEVRRTRKSRQY
jgi:hypothetical protein